MQPKNDDVFMQWVAEAKELRAQKDAAAADFFAHLKRGEDADVHKHAKAGYATFTDALIGENLAEARPYEAFKREVARFGFDHVRAFGFEQMREVLRVPEAAVSRRDPTRSAQEAIIADLGAFRQRNGAAASTRHTRTIIRQHHEPEPREPEPVDLTDPQVKIATLEKQLARVTRERDAALAKIEKLEAKLRAAGERPSGAKTAGGARKRKAA